MKTEIRNSLLLTLLLAFLFVSSMVLVPGLVHARVCSVAGTTCGTAADCPAGETCDPVMGDYCITPPFIAPILQPNLLLMIDNSASMYDLQYTDNTRHLYCANNPANSCATEGATCAGAASCYASVSTTTTTTTSSIACTAHSQCAAPPGGGTCPPGAVCAWAPGDTCFKGQCKKSVATLTVSTNAPVSCNADSDCSAITTGDTCNNKCKGSTRPCLDSSYSNTIGTYKGYFRDAVNYCYSSQVSSVAGAPGWTDCSYSGSWNEFDPTYVAMPAACTYGGSASATPYLCVNLDAGTGLVNKFVASGRFLNWLSTSKFDIQKSILTGGKVVSAFGGDLSGESRGCAGRSFIKTVPGLGLTFGIRGGESTINNTSQATQYGPTFIEIYKGTYNSDACTAAVNDWQNATATNLGPLQVDTKNCIGGGGSLADELAAANQSIHDCFWYYNGHGLTNLQPIKNVCEKIWATTPASSITDPSSPAAICSNALSHPASINDSGVGNTTGFLGSCYTGGVWDDTCALLENKDYCQSLGGGTGAVSDPPPGALVPDTVQNIPGFMMSLGVAAMPMINDYSAYANGRKGFLLAIYDTPPPGLIQKYKDSIRFGVMTFQNNGSATECGSPGIPCVDTCSNAPERQCYHKPLNPVTLLPANSRDCTGIKNPVTGAVSSGTCGSLTKVDGGKIVAYVGAGACSVATATACIVDSDCPGTESCIPSVGNHSSGLIKALDDVQATSWTPLAEGFYNAMGYFARSNAYPATGHAVPTSRKKDTDHPNDQFDLLPSPNDPSAASYLTNKNPSQYKCQSNNILIITDGSSTADKNSASEALATLYADKVPYTIGGTTYTPGGAGHDPAKNHGYDAINQCPPYSGSRSIANLAWVAKNRNIKTLSTTAASTEPPSALSESISTYVVYAGPETSSDPGLCDPKTLMQNTAANGDTTMLPASNPTDLGIQLDKALAAVAAKSASGTAASILNNSEGSGAILLQAIFYPSKEYENKTSIAWSGELINLWYFVDPFFTLSTIREETDNTSGAHPAGTHVLDISKDRRVQFFFDTASNQTKVKRYNSDGSTAIADMNSDLTGGLKTLWTAGKTLWKRDLSTDPRKIYTTVNGVAPWSFTEFSHANAAFLSSRLNAEGATAAAKTVFAEKVIDYVHGIDVCLNATVPCTSKSRNRTVEIKVSDDANETHVWKLGDIISSTPKLQGGLPLQSYDQKPPLGYSDSTYKEFYSGTNYKNRGMVYVGGNDGMLHAIRMGKVRIQSQGNEKATLNGVNLGREEWAFIPKHVMPYLKYLTLPAYNAGHLYLVDGANLLFDVATKATPARDDYWNETRAAATWKTVLLGGMGLGGATKDITATCSASVDTGTCVKTPFATHGFSSYFAIDITNQDYTPDTSTEVREQPTLLWEFAHPDLGYATSGPALVRINAKAADSPFAPQEGKNGRWFAIYASGPTGPISAANKRFIGKSDQNLKLFVVDVEKGPVVDADPKRNGLWIIDTGITEAFAGSIGNNSVVDAEMVQMFPLSENLRQDDTVYIGYTKKAGDGTWSDGGVLRLVIPDSANPDVMFNPDPAVSDPNRWQVSKVVSGIGPVTTSVSKLMSKNNLYLFFGTGRFFYPLDDMDLQRRILMVKDKCFPVKTAGGVYVRSDIIDGCNEATTPPLVLSDLTSRNTASNDAVDNGWYIDLDAGERVVTDTVSTASGTVFYTTFKPTSDPCGLGGKSFLWGVKYDTGGTLPASSKNGKVLIQLSTGSFAEIDLKDALTEKEGRRTAETSQLSFGKASADAGLFMTSAGLAPVKRVLHIQERVK